MKCFTALPIASTVPTASQPSTLAWPASGAAFLRTLVSTGFTEMAFTRTSRSRAPGLGAGSSMSCNEAASSTGQVL
ncbi:hypothetical protein AX767_12910 [Variovorax sp. PAMC 28711]|nr:hypothetical protein AX767_12910 [Variovorax sp. PAMC 28711]